MILEIIIPSHMLEILFVLLVVLLLMGDVAPSTAYGNYPSNAAPSTDNGNVGSTGNEKAAGKTALGTAALGTEAGNAHPGTAGHNDAS
jgi:uncharacterized lipoprotein YajG